MALVQALDADGALPRVMSQGKHVLHGSCSIRNFQRSGPDHASRICIGLLTSRREPLVLGGLHLHRAEVTCRSQHYQG